MGKKKKTYVRPEMKIIEVKTEGVIAASGGDIIVDPDEWMAACSPNYFNNSCHANNPKISECGLSPNSWANSCFKSGFDINKYDWKEVTLTRTYRDNKEVIIISKGWNNPKL